MRLLETTDICYQLKTSDNFSERVCLFFQFIFPP